MTFKFIFLIKIVGYPNLKKNEGELLRYVNTKTLRPCKKKTLRPFNL